MNSIVKHKYISITVGVLIGCAAIVALYFALYSGNIVSQAKVSFEGTNGHGTARITNYTQLRNELVEKMFVKNGINEKDAKVLTNAMTNNTMNEDTFKNLSSADQTKLLKLSKTVDSSKFSDTDIKFEGPSAGLKNGDKVTVAFNNQNPDLIPFKSGKKTFVVQGLQ